MVWRTEKMVVPLGRLTTQGSRTKPHESIRKQTQVCYDQDQPSNLLLVDSNELNTNGYGRL